MHLSAVTALNNKSITRIWRNTEDQRTGVSVPIFHESSIAGVLVVEGEVQEINSVIMLLKTLVEMLINQRAALDSEQQQLQIRNQFLRDWIYYREEYDPEFLARGSSLGINLSLTRIVAIIYADKEFFVPDSDKIIETLEKNDEYIHLERNRIALLLSHHPKQAHKLKRIQGIAPSIHIAIGQPSTHMYTAFTQACRSLEIGSILFPEECYWKHDSLYYIDLLLSGNNAEEIINPFDKLAQRKGPDLIETLITYIQFDGDVQKTADALFIHRNSLGYRLTKIYDITDKNPRNYQDLFYLYCAYIVYKVNGSKTVANYGI